MARLGRAAATGGTAAGRGAWRRRWLDAAAAVAGAAVVLAGMATVDGGAVPAWERALFEAVNGLPGWLYPVAWPLQQLGVLALGPVVAVVAAVARLPRLAVGALLVTVGKLAAERLVKAAVTRQRPGTSIGPDAELRGDVSVRGEAFVSGHAVLVAAVAWLVTPYLPGRWKVVPWLAVAGVCVGRVYVGAHNPLDVACGAALGVALGAAANLALGVPAAPAPPSSGRPRAGAPR